MSPFPDDKYDFDDEENKEDVVSQHARMLSVEIANRIHPSLDFFEEHLEEVKEYALVTIAQLEEVKLFLKRQNLTARLEQDFAFIDSARETLNVIERKVSEMEEDVWEKEKATVKTRVDQRVEQVKDQFGRMFSSMFSSSKE
ncbi:unnamed protein product [Bathycoccus prasinos]